MSATLFLISCSDHKRSGGTAYPAGRDTVLDLMSSRSRLLVTETRRRVFDLIKSNQLVDREKRQGPRALDPQNAALERGEEFGDRPGQGQYLPACRRYGAGRFFAAVEDASSGSNPTDLGVWTEAWRPGRWTLIVSGLYGVVRPQDPIQSYSCHLADQCGDVVNSLAVLWRPVLTHLLLELIAQHRVAHVVDLLSEQVYQDGFDWGSLYRTGVKTSHRCFRRAAGPEGLPHLGRFFRHDCLTGADFDVPHDLFLDRDYFADRDERILFESTIGATAQRVAREGIAEVEPALRDILGTTWSALDEETRLRLCNAEYSYQRNRHVEGFDFAQSSVSLAKAIECWLGTAILQRLQSDQDLEAILGETQRFKRPTERGQFELGDVEHFLRRCVREANSSEAVVRAVRGALPGIRGRSLLALCDDIREIRRNYRNDWVHAKDMPLATFEKFRQFAHGFFGRWIGLAPSQRQERTRQ